LKSLSAVYAAVCDWRTVALGTDVGRLIDSSGIAANAVDATKRIPASHTGDIIDRAKEIN